MMPLAAYADRLSVRPGETIKFQAANGTGRSVEARLVRVVSSDPNPAGLGIRTEAIDADVEKVMEPGPATVPLGSFAVVEDLAPWSSEASFTLACRVFPTHIGERTQALLARLNEAGHRGVGLMLGHHGRLRGLVGNGAGFESAEVAQPLSERRWYLVWLRFDADSRTLQAGHSPIGSISSYGGEPATANTMLSDEASLVTDSPLLMAAADYGSPNAHLNGKLERPTLYDRALDENEIQSLIQGEEPPGASARWDFAMDVSSSRIVDIGPNAMHGRLVNTPARGMTGADWSGREM